MKLYIPNPLARRVTIRYFRAEALVKKRVGNFIDTKRVWFDSATTDAAAKGLQKIVLQQNYRIHRTSPVREVVDKYAIPFWTLAFWFPWLTKKHMQKKGFAHVQ